MKSEELHAVCWKMACTAADSRDGIEVWGVRVLEEEGGYGQGIVAQPARQQGELIGTDVGRGEEGMGSSERPKNQSCCDVLESQPLSTL